MMVLAAAVYVLVLWSVFTAIIFYLDSLATRTFKWSMAAATLVLLGCAYVIWTLRDGNSTLAVAESFAAGLLAWGWTEMALYMGYITGPRKQRCSAECSGVAHFGHALSANLWHEIVVILFAVAIYVSGNATALWCFVMLWLMHLSARLNVFLGARNVSEDFVPAHMDILKGFLRRRTMNPLFPFSCAVLVGLTIYLASLPQTFEISMAATLSAIGLLEHILLMLPLPTEKLWTWSLSKKPRADENDTHETKTNDNQKHHHHTAVGALS